MVVVTGGLGHIGNVVVRALLKQGYEVGIIDKEPINKPLDFDKPVQYFQGDIRDKNFLSKIFSKAKYVIHLAGIISTMPGKEDLIYSINVDGTQNICDVCIKEKVKRLIYVSSIHALHEPPKGTPITEKLAKISEVTQAYAKSKILATKKVFKSVKKGLNAVVVYPSGVIGPFDFQISRMGALIRSILHGNKTFYIEGGYNFVDVRDVARGILLALKKGKKGDDYLLSGNNISIHSLYKIVARITKTKGPRFKIPTSVIKFIAPFAETVYKMFRKQSVLTRYAIKVVNSNYHAISNKAKKQLGYKYRDIKDTVKDTIDWLKGERIKDD
jgi:dihydroflavonol-4-reductase